MKLTDEIYRYYDRKTKCPKCHSKHLVETAIDIVEGLPEGKYKDRKNTTACMDCDWRGFIDDLKG